MTLPDEFQTHRLLLYYKGDISALTLFAQHENCSVCLPEPLPALSSILEEESGYASKVSVHPAVLVQGVNQLLNLDNDLLHSEAGFIANMSIRLKALLPCIWRALSFLTRRTS